MLLHLPGRTGLHHLLDRRQVGARIEVVGVWKRRQLEIQIGAQLRL